MTFCSKCGKEKGAIHICDHCNLYLCWRCYFDKQHQQEWVKHYGIERFRQDSEHKTDEGQPKISFGVPSSKGKQPGYGDYINADTEQEDMGDRKKEADIDRSTSVEW